MMDKKKTRSYKEGPFMNSFRKCVFNKYPDARVTYGSETTPRRKDLGLDKTHENDAIAITGITRIKELPLTTFKIKQFRKKKRSLHEATARKGRKVTNVTSRRNDKNTKELRGFHLNDLVFTKSGERGYITGFTGKSGFYVKTIEGDYITLPGKSYKQVPLKQIKRICHNNNWQFRTSNSSPTNCSAI